MQYQPGDLTGDCPLVDKYEDVFLTADCHSKKTREKEIISVKRGMETHS